MGRPALSLLSSTTADSLVKTSPLPAAPESIASLAPAGRLVELSGGEHGPSARTSTAVCLLARIQQQGETAVWLQPAAGPLYPPDFAEAGVDLDALVVIHVPASAGPHGACKAAELLLRSGAFGLVVIDLCAGAPPGSGEAWQGRLLGLARQHHARVLLLTEKPESASSLGPLVGIRVQSSRQSAATTAPTKRGSSHPRPKQFAVQHSLIKNKTGSPIAPAVQQYRGPWGL